MSLAKDVAQQLERRARRRKLVFLGAIAALVALVLSYMRCGADFGFGSGEGKGTGTAATDTPTPAPKACALRLDGKGLTLDGKAIERDAAVEACKAAGRADVVVTGDARQGDKDALRQALDDARILHNVP